MRILVADDQPMELEQLRELFEADPRFEVVASVRSGSAVLPFVTRTEPDVAVLDVDLPGLDGFECLLLLQERFPAVRVVLLAWQISPVDLAKAFALGASGLILKDELERGLLAAVHDAVTGTAYRTAGREPAATPAQLAGLTAREVQILGAVAKGLSNRDIARSLRISEPTVKFHLSNIYRRLRVSNRTEAARWALSRGIADERPASAATAAV